MQTPYLGLAAALVVLAIAIALFKLPKIDAGIGRRRRRRERRRRRHAQERLELPPPGAGRGRHLRLRRRRGGDRQLPGELLQGARHRRALPRPHGAHYVSYYWGGAMVGRFIGTFTLAHVPPGQGAGGARARRGGAGAGRPCCPPGRSAMWSIIAVGLFNSIMFPTIFTLAIDGLGKHTGQGSGILCMAIVGGALIPVIQGALADRIGIHHCFIIPVLCYLYIAWYGAAGYRRVAARRAGASLGSSRFRTPRPIDVPERAHQRRFQLAALRADADAELAELGLDRPARAPRRAAGSCPSRGAARCRRRSPG